MTDGDFRDWVAKPFGGRHVGEAGDEDAYEIDRKVDGAADGEIKTHTIYIPRSFEEPADRQRFKEYLEDAYGLDEPDS